MKREQIKKNKKKAGKRHKNLILLSLLALALTAGWYVFTTPSGKLLNTGAWFAAETDKSDTQEKQTLSAVTQKYSDETQYATGDYINVYHFLDTLEKVPNRGLQMKMGKDGCYQMNSNDDSRNFNILQLTDIHITGTEGSYKKDIQAIDTVYTMIQRTTPDFIVLTGDVIFGVDGYDANDGMRALNVVSKLMDTIGIPWTWTFGNHDQSTNSSFSFVGFVSSKRILNCPLYSLASP